MVAELLLKSHELTLFRVPSSLVVLENLSSDTGLAKSLDNIVGLISFHGCQVDSVAFSVLQSSWCHDGNERAAHASCSSLLNLSVALLAEVCLSSEEKRETFIFAHLVPLLLLKLVNVDLFLVFQQCLVAILSITILGEGVSL